MILYIQPKSGKTRSNNVKYEQNAEKGNRKWTVKGNGT